MQGNFTVGQKGKKGNIYNVDGGNELSNLELTKKMTKYVTYQEAMEELKRRGLYEAWIKERNKKADEARKASKERAMKITALSLPCVAKVTKKP